MHVFFSGIGGAGANSFALLAQEAGYDVSGSDAKASSTIDYLKKRGLNNIYISQTAEAIAAFHKVHPIDKFVYSSALPLTDRHHPELEFCRQNGIPALKHDDFLAEFIKERALKMIAVAGTHGKSTATAMAIWLAQQFDLKASWSIGAKLNFAQTGHFEPNGKYLICETDEFDRKFLRFYPAVSIITGLDWDHPDIYPTRESYYQAFGEFIDQSTITYLWHDDAEKLALEAAGNLKILDERDPGIDLKVKLPGRVNRLDAWLTAQALQPVINKPFEDLLAKLNDFPGVTRRFERLAPNLYTDYAHTPPKIRGALQLAHETAGDNVVVVYDGLHNTRQHFFKDELAGLFNSVKHLYIVPSYLAREDPNLELLTPEKILDLLSNSVKSKAEAAGLDSNLKAAIQKHIAGGDLVLCLSAGGAGSLDEWLRREFN